MHLLEKTLVRASQLLDQRVQPLAHHPVIHLHSEQQLPLPTTAHPHSGNRRQNLHLHHKSPVVAGALEPQARAVSKEIQGLEGQTTTEQILMGENLQICICK